MFGYDYYFEYATLKKKERSRFCNVKEKVFGPVKNMMKGYKK